MSCSCGVRQPSCVVIRYVAHHSTQDGDGAEEAKEEDVYRQWLRRQYAAYSSALHSVLTSDTSSPGLQVAATAALMEAVRSEKGVGVFASSAYCQLITTLVCSAAVKPEV